VLPSNVEDARFRAEPGASGGGQAEWTAGSALRAEATQPMDDVFAAASTPDGLFGLACCGLDLLGALIDALARYTLRM
jgi:hypothetical protein